MRLRLFLIVCALSVIGMVLTVRAQDDQPLSDPTIEAAVNALLAQTQTAAEQQAAGVAATQTIQAALESAISATAQAQATPTPSPTPFNAADLRLASTVELDLRAGPGGTGAFLAPDGVHLAHLAGRSFCLYVEDVEQHCIDLEERIRRIESESPQWSPDSRYLVFHEDFFRMFIDADIWVWDTVENMVTNLTDDGLERIELGSDEGWDSIDIMPRWLPDGRILFLRYHNENDTIQPPDIYTINPDGSDLEQIGTLSSVDAYAIYAIDVSADQIVYNYLPSGDSPFAGVWISDLNGENGRKIMTADRQAGIMPMGVDLSPDGRYVLVMTQPDFRGRFAAEDSMTRVIDVERRETMLIDPDQYVANAGWSPQGSALVYTTVNLPDDESADGLYVSATPGEAGEMLLQGRFYTPTSVQRQSIVWGANNAVLVMEQSEFNAVLAYLE